MSTQDVFKFYDRLYRVMGRSEISHTDAYDIACIVMRCKPVDVKDNTVLCNIQNYILTKIKTTNRGKDMYLSAFGLKRYIMQRYKDGCDFDDYVSLSNYVESFNGMHCLSSNRLQQHLIDYNKFLYNNKTY